MRGWERLPRPLAGAAGRLLGPCPGCAALGCRVLARTLAGTVHPFATVGCRCDLATQKIQELEATLYNALQQEPGQKASTALSADQREDLQAAVEKVRRQILRQSREFDSQILRERMELLQQAQQVRCGHSSSHGPCWRPSALVSQPQPACRDICWDHRPSHTTPSRDTVPLPANHSPLHPSPKALLGSPWPRGCSLGCSA